MARIILFDIGKVARAGKTHPMKDLARRRQRRFFGDRPQLFPPAPTPAPNLASATTEKIPAKNRLHIYKTRLSFNHMVKCTPRTLDRTFGALADPTRRRILESLAHGDRCVTDLAKPHRMSLPAVSKHLRVLEKAGLVCRQRDGRVHRLKLQAAPMQQAAQWIEEYRRFWEASFDRLDEYLNKLQQKEKEKHDSKK